MKNFVKLLKQGHACIEARCSKMIEKMPSGISAAMTAISASNHKQYLTIIGYSALHNSDRCFPERLRNQKNICMLVNNNNFYLPFSDSMLVWTHLC